MIRKISERIVDMQIGLNILSTSDRSIYIYGYQTMIELILITMVAMVIIVISGEASVVLGFCVAFIPLRIYSGGWHAKNLFVCAIVSGLVIYGAKVTQGCLRMLGGMYGLILEATIGIVISLMAPVATEEKELSQKEGKRYRKHTIAIIVFEFVVSIFDVLFLKMELYGILLYTFSIQVLNMLLVRFIHYVKTHYVQRFYSN